MTKAQKRLYENYKTATATNLWEVYGTHSQKKEEAMTYCRRLQYEMGGHDGRICSANSFQFSFAFLYTDEDGDKCLYYITKAQERTFKLGLE